MARRSLIVSALACLAAGLCSPASAAPSITSKRTLYCDSASPDGTTGCLFPVPQTMWPKWVNEADKAAILEMEQTLSVIGDIVGGVSMVQGYLKTATNLATALGLIKAQPTQLDEIISKLDAIRAQLDEMEQLQLKVHESLFLQSNSIRLHDTAALMRTSRSGLQSFLYAHPDYPDCLTSGALSCAPFWRSNSNDLNAFAAYNDINTALTRLDTTAVGGLDSVWLDTGLPPGFDPRAAAAYYLAGVAQELSVLTWAVGPYGLAPDFRERLKYRAAFINQVLIPNLKEWVHARCEKGPHVPDSSGTPSALGVTYHGAALPLGNYDRVGWVSTEYYAHFEWTKTCDFSSGTILVYACEVGYPWDQKQCRHLPALKPRGLSSPFFKGDPTEMATLERIGLSQWSYQAANLVGVANDASYAGCFSRAVAGKLLPSRQTVATGTAAECIQAAKSNHHSFAQLTPNGCYTGNGIGELLRIPDASCDHPCIESAGGAGSGEMCGGSADGSSVFQVAASMSALVASNLVGGKTSYVGCYPPPASTAQVLQVNSAEACLNAAVSAKTVYASVEPGGVCKLSNTLLGSAALPDSSCSSPCPAAADQTCGGAGAASVFATNDPMVAHELPLFLAASASGPKSVRLTWTDTSDSETGFRIERRLADSATAVYVPVAHVGANVTAYEDSGHDLGGFDLDEAPNLAPSTSYRYRIAAAYGATYSTFSNEASATTWPASAKAPPWLTPIVELLLE